MRTIAVIGAKIVIIVDSIRRGGRRELPKTNNIPEFPIAFADLIFCAPGGIWEIAQKENEIRFA